jgi:hypothetical protein
MCQLNLSRIELLAGIIAVGGFSITAFAKIIHVVLQPQLSAYTDPVLLGLSARTSSTIGALLEASAVLFWFLAPRTMKWYGFLVASLTLLSYKVTYVSFNISSPCQCLGILTDWLSLSARSSDLITFLLLLHTSLWSFAFTGWYHWGPWLNRCESR